MAKRCVDRLRCLWSSLWWNEYQFWRICDG